MDWLKAESSLGESRKREVNMLLSGFIVNQPKTHEQYLVEINKNTPNTATLAAMDAAEKDEDSYGPFDDVSALMEALNA